MSVMVMPEPPRILSFQEQVLFRLNVQQEILTDGKEDPAKMAAELASCWRDPVRWINRWVWTYDPREEQKVRPFICKPRQVEFIHWLQDRERTRTRGIVPKSRERGISFLAVFYAVHGLLFRHGFKCGFGSYHENKVDHRGDMGSLFEKMRFVLRHLKTWMLPPDWDWHANDNYCRIINPANESAITGEVGDNIGAGDRTAVYFVDEAALLEHPDAVERSLSATTYARIDMSAMGRPGSVFSQNWKSGRFATFPYHYRDDPDVTEEWIAAKKAEVGPVVWASQYEMDDTAGVEGICIPAVWVEAAVELELPKEQTDEADALLTPLKAGFDIAAEGTNENVICPRRGPVVEPLICWTGINLTQTCHKAIDVAIERGITDINYDCNGVGAAVKGTLETTERQYVCKFVPVNSGATPSEKERWPDGETSRQKFRNQRAVMWWKLRCRFEKAYEFKHLGIQHARDDMIAIPDDRKLITQLSTVMVEYSEGGKIQLEPKSRMKSRGIASPDRADALAFAFHASEKKLDFNLLA